MFNLYQWWGSRLGGLWLKLLVVDRIYGGCWVLKVFSTAVTEMIWGSGRLEHRKNLCVETTIFVSFFQKCSSWYGFKSVFPFTFLFLSLPFSLSVVFFVFCQLHHRFFMISAHLGWSENAGYPKFDMFIVEMMVKPVDFGRAFPLFWHTQLG